MWASYLNFRKEENLDTPHDSHPAVSLYILHNDITFYILEKYCIKVLTF